MRTDSLPGTRMMRSITQQQKLRAVVDRAQVEVATGKRLQRGSDDPAASARVAQIERRQANRTGWDRNLTLAVSLASQADAALGNLRSLAEQAQEAVLAGANGTLAASDRATYSTALRAMAKQVGELERLQSSLGTPLFPRGGEVRMRVADGIVAAPVAAAEDVFETADGPLTAQLLGAADAIASGDAARIGDAIAGMGRLVDHAARVSGEQGLRGAEFDLLQERSATLAVDDKAERSSLEDVDLTEAIGRLQAGQVTLEAAQAAFARLNRQSLFDLLG